MFRFFDYFFKVACDFEVASESELTAKGSNAAPDINSDDHYLATYSSTATNSHIFGYLEPWDEFLKMAQIDFSKDAGYYTLGSDANKCDIVLQESGIENQHCQIEWAGNKYVESDVYVHDMSSSGTYINDVAIRKCAKLNSGDYLRIGSATFRYRHTADLILPVSMHAIGVHSEYDLYSVLATGRNSVLYGARNRDNGQVWVVKRVTKPKTMKMQTFQVHTMEKSRHHPNICFLLEEFYQYDGSINLILEYVNGGNLQRYLDKNHCLPDDDAKRITSQICCGMAHVHSKGIIHRNLKPTSILLTLDKCPVVKVTGFGLAVVAKKLPVSKNPIEKTLYVAPEITNSTEDYTNKVDSWSVGIMVWMMLAGAEPVKDDKIERIEQFDTLLSTCELKIDDLRELNIELQAKHFIVALLESDPLARSPLTKSRDLPWLLE